MQRTCLGALAIAALGLAGVSSAQAPAPGEEPGWTGLTEPEEIIEARRLLMVQIEQLMLPIDELATGADGEPVALKSSAATIEAMLLAFPHLFPPTTNLFDPSVLEPPTTALPEIWQDFTAFRALAAAAEEAAAATVEADGMDSLRAAGRSLRATCDACHARFMKPYMPPVFTEEDLEFDFESIFPDD